MLILFLQTEGEVWEPNDYEVCKCSNGKQKCSERCPLEMKCKKVMQALFNLKKFFQVLVQLVPYVLIETDAHFYYFQ